MKLRLAPRAVEDLADIGDYTEEAWGRSQRMRYLEELRAALVTLQSFPRSAPPLERDPRLRVRNALQHRILYRLDGDELIVLRVIHQAQDLERVLHYLTE